MKYSYKKVFGGLVALLFVVTIVQSQAIVRLTDNASSNKTALSELATMQQAQVTATKTDSSTKRADGLDTGIYANEGKKGDETVKEVTITCTPAGCDNGVTLPYTFQYDDTIDVKYCGGGGGGGGGGKGFDVHQNIFLTTGPVNGGPGLGGGGGGGGGSAQCKAYSKVKVSSGDILTANIGTGGAGGIGGIKKVRYITNNNLPSNMPSNDSSYFLELDYNYSLLENAIASHGSYGGMTSVNLSNSSILYPNASGGGPGMFGSDATSQVTGLGGVGGALLMPVLWNNGSDGAVNQSGGIGGAGGIGESPSGANATSTTGSIGGSSATSDTSTGIAYSGMAGQLSYGGGGGSGGYGDYHEQYGCGNGPSIAQGEPLPGVFLPAPTDLYNSLCRILKGGNGGKGGDGYVKLIGVKIPPPTEAKFTTAGTHTFNWNTVPVGATVTIKVWGAGGGGGNAYENSSTTVEDIVAAGGGAGGYAEHQMVNPGNGVVPIIIGEGGAPGNMGGGNGMPGGQSKFGTSIVANGGLGGVGDVEGNQNSGVIGGAGGVAWGGSVTNTTGPAGQSGTAGGLGGNVSTPQNDIADGGQGGIINNAAGNNLTTRNALAGKPGRVEISW